MEWGEQLRFQHQMYEAECESDADFAAGTGYNAVWFIQHGRILIESYKK